MFIEEYDVQTIHTGVLAQAAEGKWTCIECGEVFEEGEVYPVQGRFYTAEKAAYLHAKAAHGCRFSQLLHTPGKYLNITDHQKNLMEMLYQGMSDGEIAAATGATAATVRRQRFMFREKAKQAKMYLALYEYINENKQPAAEQLLPVHKGATMTDARFIITQEENEQIIKNTFASLEPLRLERIPVKQKKKVAVLNLIATQFKAGVEYTEKEVNAILQEIYPDYVTLRRYLIEYGYMDRTVNGSCYWVR